MQPPIKLNKKVKFDFLCDEEWNQMKKVEGGRFCGTCSKKVTDYTGYSKTEFARLKNGEDTLCGQFAPHQVDESLILVDVSKSQKRLFTFSLLVFFGLGNQQLKAQHTNDSVQTEQIHIENKKSRESAKDKEDHEFSKYQKKRLRRKKASKVA